MKVRAKWSNIVLACVIALGCFGSFALHAAGQDAGSDLTKRKLKTKVLPDYPPIARQLSLQGKVKIETTVAADGHVTNTKVVGGNPVLASAAVDAVKKWRFEPGAKETTEIIEVDFNGKG